MKYKQNELRASIREISLTRFSSFRIVTSASLSRGEI